MKSHSELLPIYSNFAKMVETQFSKRIKIFRSDNALEYTQYAFQAFLHSYGTIHHLICPSTSQQNGQAEQKFRHILNVVRALLLSAKVLAYFGMKLLFIMFMLFFTFQALSSIIKLYMISFLRHPLPIITYALSILFVLFFFSLMSTANLNLYCFIGYGET